MNELREMNFDGLVGPTHNYAGLSSDNVASVTHRDEVANPRAAVIEGNLYVTWLDISADTATIRVVVLPEP